MTWDIFQRMSSKRRLAVVVALAIVVAGIGVYAWRRGASRIETAGDPAGRIGSERLARTPAGSAERPVGDPFGDLPVLATDDPVGSLRLEGMVLGDGDRPAAGATVVLDAAPPRTATTAADGGFAFDGLVGRTYTLTARAGAAGVAGPTRVPLTATTELVTLRLRPGATLEASVVTTAARPIAGATVELRGADVQVAMTGVDGVATFAAVVPGGYTVVASASGMAPVARPVRVTKRERVKLVLAPGAAVSGRVVDETGAPVAGAKVLAVAPGLAMDLRRDAATTEADGAFHFAALAAGSLRFVASDAVHASGTSELVVLDGAHPTDGVVIELAAGAVVRGRVVDTAKVPVEGARVEIAGVPDRGGRRRGGGPGGPGGPGPGGGGGGEARQAFTDAKGEFTLRGLPRGPLVAIATAERGAASPKTLDATSGEVANVELVLDRTEAIAGIVVDDANQPIEGAQVRADPRERAGRDPGAALERGERIARTDSAGAFRIGGLEAGGYTLRASRGGGGSGGPGGRRGRGGGDGVDAEAGATDVRIVVPAEGSVSGKVALADGTVPPIYFVSLGQAGQSFLTAAFELGELAPGTYTLDVRGSSFTTHEQDVTIASGQAVDLGTITLTPGRAIGGVVVSGGSPVAGATVYGGRQILGGGATNDSPLGGGAGAGATFGAGTKSTTTGADGTFSLSGFGEGDITVVAELAAGGRSPARRVTEGEPDAGQLVLALQPFGALSGLLHQDGSIASGIGVSVMSTTSPGAVNMVTSGADGAYRFDRLAPDTYKVSATLGQIRRGLRLYSQQVVVPAGGEAHMDLGIAAGDVTLVVTPTPTGGGTLGLAIAWVASGSVRAATESDLQLALAGAGAGTTQMQIARGGTATFTALTPGAYTACVVPLPSEIHGAGALGYMDAHGAKLPAVCVPVAITSAPPSQALAVPVAIPALVGDGSGSGSGA